MIELRTIGKQGMLVLLAIAVVFGLNAALPAAKAASGNVYYVASDGDDSNPGTESQPWRTIQKAANTMVGGDTVYVKQGIYNELVRPQNSGSSGNYITYQAYPGDAVIIDGQNARTNVFAISGKNYLIIDGFQIVNPTHRGIHINGANHLIIRNNLIEDSGHHGILAESSCSYLEIIYNEIANCTDIGVSIEGSGSNIEIAHNVVHHTLRFNGIAIDPVTNSDIHHNKVYSNNHNGIMMSHGANNNLVHHNIAYDNSCGADQRYAGIAIEVDSENNKVYNNLIYNNCHAGYLTNSPNNEIYNNVMYGNIPDQISFGDWEGSTPVNNVIKNNIFIVTRSSDHAVAFWKSGLTAPGVTYDPLSNTFDYNLYYYVNGPDKSNMVAIGVPSLSRDYSFLEWQEDAGKEQHGVLGNPQFANPDDNDFHLQSDSPAIDSGVDVGITEDFDGNPRPQGAGYDIGAYEYTGGVQPTATPQPTSTPPPVPPTPTPTLQPTSTPTPTPTPNPHELIIDNSDSRFSTSFSQDAWQEWTDVGGQHYGDTHCYNRQIGGDDTATWSFSVPQPGRHDVYAWWWEGSYRPTDVPYTINHLNGSTTVIVNQQTNGGQWNLLGTFDFQDQGSVVVSDDVSSAEDIVADAIRLVYLGPLPSATPTSTPTIGPTSTPTPTPVPPTATPTVTYTPTPTNTPTPTATSTPTPTPTPTYTPTSTLTPTPTIAPVQLPLRINSAGQDYTDTSGDLWHADQPYSANGWGYIGGSTVKRWDEDPTLDIAGTIDDPLYVTERYAMSGYQVDLPDGTYDVILHFAETFSGITGAGQRVFDVAIEGQTMLDDFDPFAEVGFAYATSKSVPNVMVTDGQLDITFIPDVQNPEINAIEVLPTGGIEPPASPWAIYLPIVTR